MFARVFLVLCLSTGCTPDGPLPDGGTGIPDGGDLTDAERLDDEERAFFTLINAHREANGVAPLQGVSISASRAAQFHSEDMANHDVFNHTLSDGTTWNQNLKNFGYDYGTAIAENIAAGNATAEATFNQWKSSSPHNANMLSGEYKVIGIGRAYAASSYYDWYWTTTFGGHVDTVFSL
jgi:uncharacterized protein YkwD